MIVKGFIEELIPPEKARVRMPDFDGEFGYSHSIDTSELNIAQVSTAYGIYPNLKIGDEVYISFLNNRLRSPIILGKVYKTTDFDDINIAPDAHLRNLTVLSNVTLPKETTIGDITAEDIQKLKNISDNIQVQLNALTNPLYEQSINCSVENYSGNYDGDYHTCTCKTNQPLHFLYSEDGVIFQDVPISYKNAGEHTIYIKAILGFQQEIFEGTVTIESDKVITFDWKEDYLVADGTPKTPEVNLIGVSEQDDVSVGVCTYKQFDINGNSTTLSSAPVQPGVYSVEILTLSGQDSDNYTFDNTTSTQIYVLDNQINESWGTISQTISINDGTYKSIEID